jgi:hypothetical protein
MADCHPGLMVPGAMRSIVPETRRNHEQRIHGEGGEAASPKMTALSPHPEELGGAKRLEG